MYLKFFNITNFDNFLGRFLAVVKIKFPKSKLQLRNFFFLISLRIR